MHAPRPPRHQATLFSHYITPPLNPALTPSLSPLYQAALFDLLFGTHGDGASHAVNVASLYSVIDEAGNTALTTAWQLVTCEDGQELIRQGDDKSEWCGRAAEAGTSHAATLCDGGYNPAVLTLQSHVAEAATLCGGGDLRVVKAVRPSCVPGATLSSTANSSSR